MGIKWGVILKNCANVYDLALSNWIETKSHKSVPVKTKQSKSSDIK